MRRWAKHLSLFKIAISCKSLDYVRSSKFHVRENAHGRVISDSGYPFRPLFDPCRIMVAQCSAAYNSTIQGARGFQKPEEINNDTLPQTTRAFSRCQVRRRRIMQSSRKGVQLGTPQGSAGPTFAAQTQRCLTLNMCTTRWIIRREGSR